MPLLYAAAGVLVFAAAVAVVWGLSSPLNVTVEGIRRMVPQDSTIGDLAQQHYVLSKPGALLSVGGGVLRIYGGDPISFIRNGVPAEENQRLFDGDVVTSASGASHKEAIVTVRVSVPATTTVQGSGMILKLVQQGKAGTDEIKRGAVSESVVSSRTTAAAAPMVFQAWLPVLTSRLVALTFDDGPLPGQTDKILDILKAEGVHATFFMLGEEARRYPALAKRVASEGNQVGNHTLDHKDLTLLRAGEVRNELVGSATQIKAASGVTPTIVRPPFGHVDGAVLRQANLAGQTVVLWNVDTADWTRPGADAILANAKREMADDAIVLMHDGGGDQTQTVEALRPLIRWLKAQGYTFVTIKEMQSAP
jgi:peptidoglycan/xylan/chitin deacetylase (PgdA/CDA1 family)